MSTKLKEDVAYGIYDRPGPSMEDDPAPAENPIVPGPQMSTQLSAEKPPIEDEDYIPTSTSALALAASEIASKVPDSQIKFFYKALHRLLDKATDRTAIEIEDVNLQNENLNKKIRSVLIEMISGDEQFKPEDLARMQSDFEEEFGDSATTDSTPGEQKPGTDKSNLENLASEFGFSGPSGARQYVNRILNRLGFMANVLDDAAIESLMGLAVPEFISTMKEGDYIDAEDVADLQGAPGIVRNLPSYKYFFVSGFILPAYREFKRKVNNDVRNSMDSAGIPKSAQDTVFNQATGLASKDPNAIRQKLTKAVSAGEIPQSDYEKVLEAARAIALGSNEATPEPSDFVDAATNKWQSLSRSRRQSVLRKALQETLDEM